jgi:hypothetical protein
MKQRCCNPKRTQYYLYGARGITICQRWLDSFENFLEDMGNKPDNSYTIDRIDVNGNYEPSNCKWSTKIEQGNNRRNNHYITVNGITRTLSEWAEVTGIKRKTIQKRIEKGWSDIDAVSLPLQRRGKK